MSKCGVFVHLLLVELRCLWLLYISVLFFLTQTTSNVFLFLRSLNVKQWCPADACQENLHALNTCVSKGVSLAAWSTDLHYENREFCTAFHGDNVLGYLHVIFICLGSVCVLFIFYKVIAKEVSSFRSGKYLVFTTKVVRHATLVQILIKLGLLWLITLTIIGPLVIMFKIPDHVINNAHTTRDKLLVNMAFTTAPSYATVFLVLWHLKDDAKAPVKFAHLLKNDIEFERSWRDLFTQTNRDLMASISNAVVKAKYGNTDDLKSLLVSKDIDIAQFVDDCNPNHKESEIAEYLELEVNDLS